MTRILHISPTDIDGGACLGAYHLHKALQRGGAESQMLVLRKYSDDPSVVPLHHPIFGGLEAMRDKVDRLPLAPYRWDKRNWFSIGWLPLDFRAAVDRLKPDLVHLHWFGRGMIPIAAIGRLRRYPLLWTMRDMWPMTGGCHYAGDCTRYETGCGACPQLGSTAEYDITRWQWRRKNKHWRDLDITYVALSSWMGAQAQRSALIAGKEIVRLGNGIDVDRFRPRDNVAARAAWRLPEDRKIILFGAMHAVSDPRKGFAYLADALRQLAAKGWGKRAVVVVFGAERIETDFGIPVRLTGQVRNDAELARLYSAADVMVAPSLHENAAKTVMEALACGTPVTAFANTGQFDLIEHRRCGYLASDRSASDLAAGIEWCLLQGKRNLAQAARAKAVAQFDVNAIARQHAGLYQRMLERRQEKIPAQQQDQRAVGDLLAPLLNAPAFGATEGGLR